MSFSEFSGSYEQPCGRGQRRLLEFTKKDRKYNFKNNNIKL